MQPPRCLNVLIVAGLIGGLSATIAPPASAAVRHLHKSAAAKAAQPVILTEQPHTDLDARARELNASDLADAKAHHDAPTVLVASAPLSSAPDDMALFVQIQSARLCGSAGCSTAVYLRHNKQWNTVLDSVSGKISVLPTSHKGMRDLLISDKDRWIWNGKEYQDTMPAAPIGDLRESIEAHQKGQHSD